MPYRVSLTWKDVVLYINAPIAPRARPEEPLIRDWRRNYPGGVPDKQHRILLLQDMQRQSKLQIRSPSINVGMY